MRHAKYRIEEGTLNNIYVHLKNKLYNIWWIRFYAKRVIFSNVLRFSQKSRQVQRYMWRHLPGHPAQPCWWVQGLTWRCTWRRNGPRAASPAWCAHPSDTVPRASRTSLAPPELQTPDRTCHSPGGSTSFTRGQHLSHQGHQCRPVSGIT